MNNFRLFANSYVEIVLPLEEKTVKALEQSEYAYLLNDFNRANENPAYSSVGLTMTVSFDFKSMETFFSLETISPPV